MSDLTTKAAEIRAGLVAQLRKPAPKFGLEEFDPTYDLRYEAADLIEQQAAELAEARAENGKLVELTKFWIDDSVAAHRAHTTTESERDSWRRVCERLETEKQAALAERDELLREKERLGAALEPFARADRALGRTPGSDRTFRLETDTGYREIHRDAFRRARSALENSKAGLADANSKSPDPSSQSERIAVLEAALRKKDEALKPFAEAADACDVADDLRAGLVRTEQDIWESPPAASITFGDLIRARSALAPLGEE